MNVDGCENSEELLKTAEQVKIRRAHIYNTWETDMNSI